MSPVFCYNHALALHLLVLLIHVYCLPEPDLTGSIYLDFTMFPPHKKKKKHSSMSFILTSQVIIIKAFYIWKCHLRPRHRTGISWWL